MKKIISNDWYQYWVEEGKAIIIQTLRTSRMALIEGKWRLGEHIETNVQKFPYGQHISQKIADDLGISVREVNRCRQFYKYTIKQLKAKDWDTVSKSLPEEKGISWHQIVRHYLPEPKSEDHKHQWEKVLRCKICGKIKRL